MKARLVSEWTAGLPEEGMTVSLDDDGGITIKSASGVVVSIIDRPGDERPGFEPFVSVEAYPYDIGSRTLGVDHLDPESQRNPRTRVSRYWVEVKA